MRAALLAVLFLGATGAAAQDSVLLRTAPVADPVLAAARGTFLLPSGQELAMTIRTDTAVNGQLVLRSVFAIDNGAPTLSVFGSDTQAPAAATAIRPVGLPSSAQLSVSIDPLTGMPAIRSNLASSAPTISIGQAAPQAASDAGLTQLPIVVGGPAIETANGTVRALTANGGSLVTLQGGDISVGQLLGPSLALVLANSGSDRTIDTTTTVDLGLSDLTSTVVDSAMLRVAGLVESIARTPF